MNRIKEGWKNKNNKRYRIIIFLVVLFFMATRLWAWVELNHADANLANSHYTSAVQSDIDSLRDQFSIYADTLYSTRALYLTNGNVSQKDWANFFSSQGIAQRYPGILGISYVSVINQSQIPSLTETLNQNATSSNAPQISIHPATDESQLAVITYSEAMNSNKTNIGYNLYSDPTRIQTLDKARDTGLPQVSPPITLTTSPKGTPPIFLMVMPIYQQNQNVPLDTVTQRQASLQGYVTLGVYSKELLDSIFNSSNAYKGISVAISTENKQFYHLAKSSGKQMSKMVDVQVAGQTWVLNFSAPTTLGLSNATLEMPEIILLSAIPMAIVLGFTLYFATRLSELRCKHKFLSHKNNS